ncbi:prolyl endopeptidase-like, partial [Saccoglossus kowalevskii]|uniref:Prolyl endopeptidase-like n=1 Tax=Saccoglossus kowalevskii TaxID=10224 RepID=A0ABM0MB37_SACKO
LMKVDSNGDLTKEQWQDVYVAGEHTKIIDMDVFDNHCVLLMKHKGIPGVTVIPLQCPSEHKSIQLPVTSCVLLPNDNPDFYSTMYDFTLASPILPAVKYKVDMKSNVINNTDGESEFWLDKDEHYTCQRIDAISKDGCEIGMTVFYQSNLPLDGNNPMLVYGYGAYGEDMNLNYKPQQMILLNRGWIIVFTHV